MDWQALFLTLQLAALTTLILLVLVTPLAWWLARGQGMMRMVTESIIAMPLVLPPTVLGFYLLLLFNPQAPLGAFWLSLTGETLTFRFEGLLVASLIYSLPFAAQPLIAAFRNFDMRQWQAAQLYSCSRFDLFVTLVMPQHYRAFISAAALSFAHVLGEFGVVLMIGGNVAGETRVMSIALFEAVETLDYATAHQMALTLVVLSLALLMLAYGAGGMRQSGRTA